MESNEGRVFGAVEYTEKDAPEDWRTLGREELLKRAILALDGAKMEAEEAGDDHYVRHVDAVLFPFLEAELKKATGEADSWMSPEERAHYDARADHEAWSYAQEIMEPWMVIVRSIASDKLTGVMERAFAEVEREVGLTLDVLEDLDEGVKPPGGYRGVLERISRAHGFSGAEEVARLASERDPSYAVKDLLEVPAGGFGTALDEVLHMTAAERWRLSRAFARTFMSLDRLEKAKD